MKRSLLMMFAALTVTTSYAQGIAGTWKGVLNAGMQKLEIVYHISKDDKGNSVVKMDVPEQNAVGIPVKANLVSADSVSLEVPAIQAKYTGKLVGSTIKGTFNQFGMPFALDLERSVSDKPARPQEPQAPFDYKTEEVTFVNKTGITLSGTLTYPSGHVGGRKTPVVIMVTGSGAQNRDEEVFGHKPFLVIADFLARHGISSLRYDDRGVGKSSGKQAGCTSSDFADDAKAGLDWLKASGKFDKVGILGHSEGGMIAFMLGADNAADFIVSLAGTGIKGDTLLAEQQNAALRLYGKPAVRTVKQVRAEVSAQPKNEWLEFFMDYNPVEDISKTSVPVMAVNGSYDMQVSAESNLKQIRKLLSGKNPKNFIKEYPGLNHLFQHCRADNALEYYLIEETFSAEVLEDIVKWINGL